MRTNKLLLALAALLAAGSATGCKWTEFDDLASTTWVRSSNDPNIGSTAYATAIVGVTTQSQMTGGQLAVVSNDVPTYSTLEYSDTGDATVGSNTQKLGLHFIASLSEQPILVTDGDGKVALVERAIDAGNIAVVMGQANMVSDAPFASADPPDAATFANKGGDLLVAAGSSIYTVTGQGAPTQCTSMDSTFKVAAMKSDGTNLWVWTQTGQFGSIPIASLTPCTGGLPAFGATFTTTSVMMPAPPAQIHLAGNYAILAGHAADSTAGQVFVVDTTNLMQGATLAVEGLSSSALDTFGTATYLALGIPSRSVDGLMNAGQVELYALDTTTGALGSVSQDLNDAQPESGQEFGRAVTTMRFNKKTILVVGAHSEVFAYYKTSLYDALP